MFTVIICGKINSENLTNISNKVSVAAHSAGYYPIEITEPINDNEALHCEVRLGVSQFYHSMSCNYMIYLNCLPKSNKKVKYSCSEISDDLSDYFVKVKKKSDFLFFIKELSEVLSIDLTEEFYIIFADEWDENQDIRLIETDLKGMDNYFSTNHSWYFSLYDVSQKCYVIRHSFYIPLAFKITHKCSP